MPYLENDVVQYFEREIKESANEQIKQLKKEINNTKKKQLKQIEDQIRDTVDRVIEIELNEINTEFSAATNRIKTSAHQAVIKKKHELLDSILLEVYKKCIAYVKKDNYRTNMEQLVKRVNTDFCGENFTFRIKKGDSILENIISKNFDKDYKVITDDSIKIGGFIGVCTKKGILTDQTVDNRLEEARVKLYEKSSLAVK
ncbi:MAG: hypothetical protein KAH13_00385 [Tenericutes bacterium]|nr:hypothetical protein [Mycoplasmatota bacterium]